MLLHVIIIKFHYSNMLEFLKYHWVTSTCYLLLSYQNDHICLGVMILKEYFPDQEDQYLPGNY